MRSGRECSRPNRNESHIFCQLYQMLIQEGISYPSWGNGGEGVSHASSAQKVYFNKNNP